MMVKAEQNDMDDVWGIKDKDIVKGTFCQSSSLCFLALQGVEKLCSCEIQITLWEKWTQHKCLDTEKCLRVQML